MLDQHADQPCSVKGARVTREKRLWNLAEKRPSGVSFSYA